MESEEPPLWDWKSVVWVCAASASVWSSVWLLRKVQRLPSDISSKLLPRQLWHLACADIIAFSLLHMGSLYNTISIVFPELKRVVPHRKAYYLLCVPNLWYRFGIIASAFVEVHLAASMLATRMRRHYVLNFLSNHLNAVWIAAFIIGSASILVTYIWDNNHLSDDYHCSGRYKGSNVKNVVVVVSLVICLSVYLYLGAQWRQVSGVQQRRVFTQAGLLLLANILCCTPRAVLQMTGWTLKQNVLDAPYFFIQFIIEPLYALGGFVNCVVYFVLHQRARRMLRSAVTVQRPTEETPSQVQIEIGSFSVAFGQTEVIQVPPLEMFAQRRAQREMGRLEAERRLEQEEISEWLDEADRSNGILERLASREVFSIFDAVWLETQEGSHGRTPL